VDDVLSPGLSPLQSIDQVDRGLSAAGYIANRQISTAIYMAHHLQKPILVEGPAGVGKTELAKSVASWMKLPLIRMQCYEGLDESKALYEWKYGKQLLYTQILKDKSVPSLAIPIIWRPRWINCTRSETSSSPNSSWSRAHCCARWKNPAAPCC
jgi:hypothetical protein